jgi:hypothetical protein
VMDSPMGGILTSRAMKGFWDTVGVLAPPFNGEIAPF